MYETPKHTQPFPGFPPPLISERGPGKLKYNKYMDINSIAERIIFERDPAKRQDILDQLTLQEIFEVLCILGHKE
jgi:hypothetical protein